MFGQTFYHDGKIAYSAGIAYTLPMLVVLRAQVDTRGIFRLVLNREDIPLTSRLRGAFSFDTQKEYMGGLRYIVTRHLSVAANYTTNYGFGGGVVVTY